MNTSFKDYLHQINNSFVSKVITPTPLNYSPIISRKVGNEVYLKREDLTPVFSFKLRGAFNKIAGLTEDQRAQGVITASAGNHAQGVAFSGRYFNCKTVIVMPVTTPKIKIDAVRKLGAEVLLFGDTFQEAQEEAYRVAEAKQYVFVHPFNDPEVIAGGGTVAKEVCEQFDAKIDYVFIPVGGGGILSGMALYLKQMRPQTKIIGVEPIEAASMTESIKARKVVKLDWVGTFADGVAVKQVGTETFRICSELVDEMVLVSTDEICSAIKDIYEDTRTILEPSGALSVAGLKKYAEAKGLSNQNLIAVASGANMNFARLPHVAERASIGENKEAIIAVEIPEKPGSLRNFCKIIGNHSITEFNYRYADSLAAHIFVGLEISNPKDKAQLFNKLTEGGFNFTDLSESELAKVHIRHLVGGHAKAENERIFRFEFPERPGALIDFLDKMNSSWNISLFHYRCHGSDRGRVLIGIQVPVQDYQQFDEFLKKVQYSYWEETDNQACKLFLQ